MSIAAQYYFVKEGRSGRYSYILGEIYQEQAVPHRVQLYMICLESHISYIETSFCNCRKNPMLSTFLVSINPPAMEILQSERQNNKIFIREGFYKMLQI